MVQLSPKKVIAGLSEAEVLKIFQKVLGYHLKTLERTCVMENKSFGSYLSEIKHKFADCRTIGDIRTLINNTVETVKPESSDNPSCLGHFYKSPLTTKIVLQRYFDLLLGAAEKFGFENKPLALNQESKRTVDSKEEFLAQLRDSRLVLMKLAKKAMKVVNKDLVQFSGKNLEQKKLNRKVYELCQNYAKYQKGIKSPEAMSIVEGGRMREIQHSMTPEGGMALLYPSVSELCTAVLRLYNYTEGRAPESKEEKVQGISSVAALAQPSAVQVAADSKQQVTGLSLKTPQEVKVRGFAGASQRLLAKLTSVGTPQTVIASGISTGQSKEEKTQVKTPNRSALKTLIAAASAEAKRQPATNVKEHKEMKASSAGLFSRLILIPSAAPREVTRFLRLVAEGEQDKAEALLSANPALALASGSVIDLSKRRFANITAFQYALWAMDWHMWTMLLKYLPKPEAAEVTQFLRLVAEGEQDKAEALLSANPALALASGSVTDLSERRFANITAFQYALWAMDWHMWTMLLKYLPKPEAAAQARALEADGTEHGAHFNLNELPQVLNTYIENYNSWDDSMRAHQWCKVVGGAQRRLPAHVVNEYCRPDRSFHPTPTFTDTRLPRTRAIDEYVWDNEWFSADVWVIGVSAAILGAWDTPVGRPEGVGAWETCKVDLAALQSLSTVRTQQLESLLSALFLDLPAEVKPGMR